MMSQKKAWTVVLLGALFFFYGFFQVNMMSALEEPLIREFQTTSGWIGLLSANFFYATIIFILPAGLMLDRFSVRYIMLINMFIAIAGVVLFAFSTDITMAAIARFISGIMMAFCMISSMKRASILLPEKAMSLASSLIVTVGMLGGLSANILMETIVVSIGWRKALIVVALLGVLISIVLSLVVGKYENMAAERSTMPILESLRAVIKEKHNWLCGVFTCLLNLPLSILGALFGISYLMQVYGIGQIESASMTSMLFLGLIFGTAFFGWISNAIGKMKPAMFGGSALCIGLSLILLYSGLSNPIYLYLVLFAIGFMSGAQVLGYPIIIENNTKHLTATALGFASIMIMGVGYGLGLPFVGWLLDLNWSGELIGGVPVYSPKAYQWAFATIPIGITIGLFLTFFMREKGHET